MRPDLAMPLKSIDIFYMSKDMLLYSIITY
ncbi:hypothetical protein HYPGJ_31657 [Hyphomicrobium sp. GJ21]|nr:hypothetical protein HYPGJ_31657 [Hyphomicrobium sp. GJ21]